MSWITWYKERASLAAIAVMLLASAVVFVPYLVREDVLLGPRSGLGTDIAYRHWPDLTYYARVIREERTVPLWDDAVAGGRPLAGDPGILWLYPFDLLFLVLPPALAFNWLGMLHVLIGGTGNYAFLRQLKLAPLPALLGGIAYMLSPKIIAHLAGGHVGLVGGAAWIPWAMLGTHRATEGDWKGTLLAGLALALQLPTHIQIPFYTAWLMVAYSVWRLVLSLPHRPIGSHWAWTAAIVPSFVAFSAAQLLPLIGLLPYASRQGFSLQDASWFSLPPALGLTLLSPTRFQFPEWVLYPGATTLILAFVAFFGKRKREAGFWVSIVVFALLYAVGPLTPLFRLLHRVPGFAQLRVPPRIWFIGGFAMTVLAALGADSAAQQKTHQSLYRSRRWLRPLSLLVYASEAATALVLLVTGTLASRLLATVAVSLLTIGLLAVCQRRELQSQHLLVGLVMITVVELVPTASLYAKPIPVDELLPQTPSLDFLQSQPGQWRVYSTHGELPYGSAAPDIQAAEGLLALQMGHYVELIKQASGCLVDGYGTGVPPCITTEVDSGAYRETEPDPALLGLLNVRYVLTSLRYDIPGLEPVAKLGKSRIYENRQWLPRAFVVFHTHSLPDQEAVLNTLNTVDPGKTVLLEESPISLAPRPLPLVAAKITEKSANATLISVETPQTGMLVVSRTWMPGWRAWVDEEPVEVHRVDHALQGVLVPPGKHQVRLRYQPIAWRLGWPISLITATVATLLAIRWTIRHWLSAKERKPSKHLS